MDKLKIRHLFKDQKKFFCPFQDRGDEVINSHI